MSYLAVLQGLGFASPAFMRRLSFHYHAISGSFETSVHCCC